MEFFTGRPDAASSNLQMVITASGTWVQSGAGVASATKLVPQATLEADYFPPSVGGPMESSYIFAAESNRSMGTPDITSFRLSVSTQGQVAVGDPTSAPNQSAVHFYVAASSATIDGQLNIGWEQITNACGAGVTTCTATCSANKVILGGGCTSTVALTSSSSGGAKSSWTCTSAIGTITAYVTCARLGP
jgi:hypothetical protein